MKLISLPLHSCDLFDFSIFFLNDSGIFFPPATLGIQQKYIIVTCNYVARKFGVKKLMYISDAKKKCPELVLVSGEDLTHYREYSDKVTGKTASSVHKIKSFFKGCHIGQKFSMQLKFQKFN